MKLPECLGALLLAGMLQAGCSGAPSAEKVSSTAPEPSAETAASTEKAPPAEQTGGFDGQRAFEQVAKLVSFGPRPPDTEALHHSQEYIIGQLKGYGCEVAQDDFHSQTPVGTVAMKNIIAKAPGGGEKIILLLTHYDTLKKDNFVGAVDSGSSSGMMLEMARLLCGRKNEDSIQMAFLDGEEAFVQWSDSDSTYGSRELAARMAVSGDLKKIKAVMLADMIGPYNLRIQKDTNSTPWLTDLVWGTAERLGYSRYFVDESTAVEDDHLPFTRRGVPSVDVIELVDYPYWHTTQDTIDKVSPKSLAIVGHVFLVSIDVLEKRN
jgi:glutaminyl-peptide cyclotransferase